jgi:hypothetical protein
MHLVMDIIPNEPRGDSSMHEIQQYTIAKMKIMFKKIEEMELSGTAYVGTEDKPDRGPKKEGA